MKPHQLLTITSLLSVVLFSLHWADEISRGMEPGTVAGVGGLAILFVWLYGAFVIPERRIGLVIILLGALLASAVPILHMQGAGMVGRRILPNTSGAFFWVWTNIALGGSGMLSLAVATRELWRVIVRRQVR